MSDYSHENEYLKKRVRALEGENKYVLMILPQCSYAHVLKCRSLLEQLKKLQALVSCGNQGSGSSHAKVGTCIMVRMCVE